MASSTLEKISDWWNNACSFCRRSRDVMAIVAYTLIAYFFVVGVDQIMKAVHNDSPALEFRQGHSDRAIVEPNEVITFYQPVAKKRDCQGLITHFLIGQCGHHVLRTDENVIKKGFDGQLVLSFKIPNEAIPGTCEYRIAAKYTCNVFDFILNRQAFFSDPIDFIVEKRK